MIKSLIVASVMSAVSLSAFAGINDGLTGSNLKNSITSCKAGYSHMCSGLIGGSFYTINPETGVVNQVPFKSYNYSSSSDAKKAIKSALSLQMLDSAIADAIAKAKAEQIELSAIALDLALAVNKQSVLDRVNAELTVPVAGIEGIVTRIRDLKVKISTLHTAAELSVQFSIGETAGRDAVKSHIAKQASASTVDVVYNANGKIDAAATIRAIAMAEFTAGYNGGIAMGKLNAASSPLSIAKDARVAGHIDVTSAQAASLTVDAGYGPNTLRESLAEYEITITADAWVEIDGFLAEAIETAFNDGYDSGYADGYADGFSDGVASVR